jgi:uncharacterized protein with HEPN domain
MSRSDGVYIQDIIESINTIFLYLENKIESDFSTEQILQDAVIRRFEIIGEAATKISDATKAAHPEIEWRLMKLCETKSFTNIWVFRRAQYTIPQLSTYLN